MFVLALAIGIYSYIIFFIGLIGKINYVTIFITSFLFLGLVVYLLEKRMYPKSEIIVLFKSRKKRIVFFLLFIFSIINLVGALGPETAFDSLWYHLTIPKIFIEKGSTYFIEGNLFYYSLMPKLTEMLYLSSLILSNEILAKTIHFMFGILALCVVYKLARLYTNKFYSLVASLIFYSNLVVAWLSITAFADLTRAFYESLSLCSYLLFKTQNKERYLILSAAFLGFSIASKVLSILSVPIFILLLFLNNKESLEIKIRNSFKFLLITFVVSSPFYLQSFYYTQNPVYPLFSKLKFENYNSLTFDFERILLAFRDFFITSQDPVSPIYLIIFPFFILHIKNLYQKYKNLVLFVLFSLVVLAITPTEGGGRFIVQFLPAYSVLTVLTIQNMNSKIIKKTLLVTVFAITIINLSYRSLANYKYIPVIFNFQTKENFLLSNLNFNFGDFYDEKNKIKEIVGNDKVLILGYHNLYYVDFAFTLEDWKDEDFKYVLTNESKVPEKYKNSEKVYENKITKANLYKLNK